MPIARAKAQNRAKSNTTLSTKMQGNRCVFFLSLFSRLGPDFNSHKDSKKTQLLHQLQYFSSKEKKKKQNKGKENGYRVSLLTVLAICSALRTKSSIKVHFSCRKLRTRELSFMFHVRSYSSDKTVYHSQFISGILNLNQWITTITTITQQSISININIIKMAKNPIIIYYSMKFKAVFSIFDLRFCVRFIQFWKILYVYVHSCGWSTNKYGLL